MAQRFMRNAGGGIFFYNQALIDRPDLKLSECLQDGSPLSEKVEEAALESVLDTLPTLETLPVKTAKK